MRYISLFVALTLLASVNVEPSLAQWEETNGTEGGYVNCFAVNGGNLFVGTTTGIYCSTNGGTDWSVVDTLMTNTDILSLVAGGSNLFAGTFRGVMRSTDEGATWASIDSGMTNTDVLSLAVSGTDLYAGTENGLFLSTNSGASWTEVDSGLTDKWVCALATAGANLYAGTHRSGVFLSTNGGTSWMPTDSGLTNKWALCLVASGANLFAGTDDGLFLSTDDGTSWTAAGLTNTRVYSIAAIPNGADAENVFAGVEYFGNVVVVPGGTVSSRSVSSPSLLTGSDSTGVFLSSDNGTTWAGLDSGLINPYVTALVASGTNLLAGTWGGGVWYRPLSQMITSVQGHPKPLPAGFSLQQNYPNPFNPTTVIQFNVLRPGFVILKVYDVLGREVATLVNGQENSGEHTVTFNASRLPSGVYFYRLQAGSCTETKKCLLLK